MTWIGIGVGGGALLGGLFSGIGSSNAASTQANASEQAAQIQQNEFNTITQQETPYMQSGYGALSNLDYLLGITPNQGASTSTPGVNSANGLPQGGSSGATASDTATMGVMGGPLATLGYSASTGAPAAASSAAGGYGSLNAPFTAQTMQEYSPAYQFQLQQGMQGTLNSEANGQGALSGAAQQALVGFNQNYANSAFNNAFQQYQTQQQNTYSRLSSIAQLGQNAASNTGQQGTTLAGAEGSAVAASGADLAAGQVGVANAATGALGTLGSIPYLESLNNTANQLTPYTVTGAGASYM